MVENAERNGKLEESLAQVLASVAQLNVSQATLNAAMSKLAERQVDADQRWFELKDTMHQVVDVLTHHTKMLERLPDELREKIGFRREDGEGGD